MRIFVWLILTGPFFISCNCEEHLKIGGLFDDTDDVAELAFRYAVEIANTEILAPSNSKQLEAISVNVPDKNEFFVSKKLCQLFKSGIAAVLGPQSPSSALHVQSICDAKEMPHIETRWDPSEDIPSLNIHPQPQTIAKVFVDLIKIWEWEGFTIIYENAPYLSAISDLLKLYDPKGHTVTIRQLDLGLQNNYRAVLRRVKLSDEKNIVIDCSVEILPEVLKQAQQVGLMTDQHQFLITSLDLHTIELEPFQYSGSNITGITLIDPADQRVQLVTEYWKNQQEQRNEELPDELQPQYIRTSTALVFDSVMLFAEAFQQLKGTHQLESIPLYCNDSVTWGNGYSLLNYMKTSNVRGLTRDIKFDHKGQRTDFTLDIIELGMAGLTKIGVWSSTQGLNLMRKSKLTSSSLDDDGSLKNKTFIVLTALSPPYGMLKESAHELTGNDRFEGIGIDLIHELSLMLGFNYTFLLQEDGVYGSLNDKGEWNGMIKELLEYRADLAITDLTITSDRESAVDFTMPFMNLGISILYQKPKKEPPSLFSFMSPFSNEVWLYLGGGYIGVSLCLFILGRISPAEWDNPYPCIEEPLVLENQFSLRNSLWFTIGALLQQGTELAPKGPSTRAVASIWWFFTLIMVSSYTANLAAFLTVESISSPINNAEDLANANGVIKYGAKRDGSTISFFKDAEYPTYKKMYQYMMEHEDLLTSSNPAGLERVKNENYAFLMESTSIEYIIERECEVTQVGGLLDDKGYGIAMRKYAPYRNALSTAVLRLQEQGKLAQLKIKWWKEKRGGGACSAASEDSVALALELANVGGVFVLLVTGSFLAIIINMLEFFFTIKRRSNENKKGNSDDDGAEHLDMANVGGVFFVLLVGASLASCYGCCECFYLIVSRAKRHHVPFREEFIEEIKFVARCHGNTKVVRHRKSSSTESRNSGGSNSKQSLGTRLSTSLEKEIVAPTMSSYGFKGNVLKNSEKKFNDDA